MSSIAIIQSPAQANNAPQFTISNTTFTTDENTTWSTTITASDPDNDPLTFGFIQGSPYSNLFEIIAGADHNTKILRLKQPANHEANPNLSVTIYVNDGQSTDTRVVSLTVKDVNEVPQFTSSTNSYSVEENKPFSTTLQASDPEGHSVGYVLLG